MLASVDQLIDYLGQDADPDRAQAALEHASALVRGFTRQQLTAGQSDERHVLGRPSTVLLLRELPIVAVELVAVDGETVEDWWVSDVGALRHPAPHRDNGDRRYRPSQWPAGPPIVVSYSHGYDPVPDDLAAATIQIAARAVGNPLGVRQEQIGHTSVTYAGRGDTVLLSGERDLLARYRL